MLVHGARINSWYSRTVSNNRLCQRFHLLSIGATGHCSKARQHSSRQVVTNVVDDIGAAVVVVVSAKKINDEATPCNSVGDKPLATRDANTRPFSQLSQSAGALLVVVEML